MRQHPARPTEPADPSCKSTRYTTANQRHGKAEVTGELVIMNWTPAQLGGLWF
ncbi:hypothetical protein LOY46_13900 [Pseudomonas sichuanensis]|nr:hypothetical protein [Pseudomonas sichuanensis]UVK80686.1 hypothetical protein LOY46_13900 [Pseudomonas sichuanensis]